MARSDTADVSNAQVENRSPTPIRELYIKKVGVEDWGKSIIDETIAAGGVRHLSIPADVCKYDLRIVYQDGRSEEKQSVDLCQGLAVLEPPSEQEPAPEPTTAHPVPTLKR